jgi:RNA polymerase sigma factor (sigma-70 family)
MNAANVERILRHIRQLAGEREAPLPDAELLRRYLATRDESAFAALVRRHGPMVFAVCQSVLRRRHDAEDAFQAVFLVLARKAGSIRRPESLSSFLQGVAYRMSLKARADNVRRQLREAKAPFLEPAVSASDDLSWGELRAVLHAELSALPERLREPLVLCYLEGLTQDEAARRLGWTPATVKGRLQRGREKLRRRLERRGVALTAALAAALTGQALAETAVRMAPPFTVATVTSAATTLASGFLRSWLPMKLAMLSAVLLSAGLVAGGAVMQSPKPQSGEAAAPSAEKPAAERSAARTDLYGDPLPKGAIARMGSIQLRHTGLSDFLVLPDGKTILTAGDRVLHFWDMAAGKQVREVKLQGAAGPVGHATLSPDGKIVAALNQKQLVFWEVQSGKQIKKIDGQPENAVFLHFSPDGKTLAVGTWDAKATLWEWQKKKERQVPLPDRKAGIDSTFHGCFSPDGKWFVAGGGWFNPLCVYESATGREVHRLNCYASISTISPDSKRLAVASMRNDKGGAETVLRFFDLANGKELAHYPLGHKNSYFFLSFSPDGKTLACGRSERDCLLDCATGRVVHNLSCWTDGVAFSPDGKTLVSGSGSRLRLWDTATGRECLNRPGDFAGRPAPAVSPDGHLLASANWIDATINLWDAASGRLLRALPLKEKMRYVCNLTFSSDGKTLIAGCEREDALLFWDAGTGKEQRIVQLKDANRQNSPMIDFHQMHIAADGKRVSTLERFFAPGESTRLALWDMATGKLVSRHSLPPRLLSPYSLESVWLADGMAVVLRLKDGLTRMRVETGAVRFRIPDTSSVNALAASPDDRLLAAVRPAEAEKRAVVCVWESATGKEVATVATGQASRLALTPDNRLLVAAEGKRLGVWDLATGKERCRWSLPESATRLLLSPNGRRVFTALADGTALVWDLTPSFHRGEALANNPGEKELAAWWTDLASDDAKRAYAAIWRLSESPETAVAFLRRRLKPATDADLKEIRRHIADLDSDTFAVREKAFKHLAMLGDAAEPALRRTLENKPSVEVRRRIQLLLEKLGEQLPSGEALRTLRALEVLEHTGAAGRRLLHELAMGAEGARLTREAAAALTRLNRRSP